jgi:hypothetical protein
MEGSAAMKPQTLEDREDRDEASGTVRANQGKLSDEGIPDCARNGGTLRKGSSTAAERGAGQTMNRPRGEMRE